MKKILLLVLMLFPLSVFAGSCQNISPMEVTPFDIDRANGEFGYTIEGIGEVDTFCIDPNVMDPDFVNYSCNLDISDSTDRFYIGIYRMWLIDSSGNWFTVRNAMRAVNKGFDSMKGDQTAIKYYCGGACASDSSSCNTGICSGYLNGLETRWLSATFNDFKPSIQETGTDEEHIDGIYSFEMYGTGYNNLTSIMSSEGYKNLNASIVITGCSVNDSRFTCSIYKDGYKEITGKEYNTDFLKQNTQRVKLTSNSVINSSADVKVTINYTFHFPFAAAGSAIKIYGCRGSNRCSATEKRPDDFGRATQRLMYVNDDVSDSVSTPVRTVVPPACRTQGSGTNKKYMIGNRVVSLLEYLEAGCCKNVDTADLVPSSPAETPSSPEIDAYRNVCLKDDKVNFELECGTKSKVNSILDHVGNSSYDSKMCTNEVYSNYSHSYVWQMGIDRVLRQLEIKEKGAYMYNLNGVYEDNIASYTDPDYMNYTLTGKNNNLPAIPAASGNNKYCMLLVSEVDDMYFPGTTIATSGRFFVFNELNQQECIDAEEPGPNCFRQPHIDGRVNLAFHTNFDKWDRDYQAAIEKEKKATSGYEYRLAQAERQTLEKYKAECETRAKSVAQYWNYNLEPTLEFGFKQRVYSGRENSEVLDEKVAMSISTKAERYWPKESTNATCKASGGSYSGKTYIRPDGSSYTVDKTTNYFYDCSRNVYYRPERATYATLATNQYTLIDESFQTEVEKIENGLRIGYVYNVQLTAYEGTYTTYFTPGRMGHYSNHSNKSNVQEILNQYSKQIGEQLSSECFYCNDYGEFDRECLTCDEDIPSLQPVYVYRSISLSDVTPNIRENTNWSDAKGVAAKELIQAAAGEKIVEQTSLDEKTTLSEYKPVILGEVNNHELKVENLAGTDIYNDATGEYLEYEMNLSSTDMQIIRENTRREEFSYADFTICNASLAGNGVKSRTANYCFTCNKDGKECESTFIDAFANTAVTYATRNSKWKYFIDGKWYSGTMEDLLDGNYPDPTNQEAWLKIHENWP